MKLTKEQILQVNKQIKAHKHKNYATNIVLTEGIIIKKFKVFEKVLRPEKMNAIFLARWLYFNNGIYKNKVVIDMGCGSGVQGIVCALFGAKNVIFSDIDNSSYKNTLENVNLFGLKNKCEVLEGDLFEKIKEKADIIVFNHPFFHDDSFERHIKQGFLGRGKLIHRFLNDAKSFLKEGGIIIMPYFHLAGEINDPAVQGPKHGYSIKEKFNFNTKTILQRGANSVYILKLK